jgi:23S rRNA (guanine745-N1)-methyltransferase
MVAERHRAIDAVAAFLRCPVCAGQVLAGADQVSCQRGHSFNIARQGYVSLTSGRGGPGTGDSAAMVMAREEFLGAGHYRPLAGAIAGLAVTLDRGAPGLVLDLAGGTGYYLAGVLDALPGRLGICVDLSAPALRRAARAHPRAAALGADAWQPLPLADGAAALVLSVFGPRNPAEIRRVLAPGGALIVATPGAAHLAELREPLGLIGMDERKTARLADAYRAYAAVAEHTVRYSLRLGHPAVRDLVAMGPNARHIGAEVLPERVAALPDQVTVTVEVELRGYRDTSITELSHRRRSMESMTFTAAPIAGRGVLDLSFLLTHASHVLATRMTAAFAEIGITPREYCVLAHAMAGSYTQIELAKVADLDKTTMLNTMDYLERAGYAQRTPSPADRRARIITVTQAGAGLVAAGHEIADRVHREVLDALPADQRKVFTGALTSLVTGILAEPVTSDRAVRRARVPS